MTSRFNALLGGLLMLALSGCASLPGLGTSTSPVGSAAPGASQTTTPATAQASGKVTVPSAPIIPQGPLAAIAPTETANEASVATVRPPDDIWERLDRHFAMPDVDSPTVDKFERWYAQRPDYISRMTERSSKYLFHIVEEVERRRMPAEIALLPFIESAFNPGAVSSAKAAGMWQFMPATGKDFDLRQNMFRDDRRDVLQSTKAALDYLEKLHAMFGDWQLALAAYNWGPGNISKAIARNQKQGLPTGYADLKLPKETAEYVPKLLAVKNIIQKSDAFGLNLPAIGNHPFFDTVDLDRDIDVTTAARLARVSEAEFRQLNPSLNKPMIIAAATPTILLPWANAGYFETALKSYNGQLASWTSWRVPKTMSAAEVAREHNMLEAELRDLNKIPARMRIKSGSVLLVPRTGKLNHDVPDQVADNATVQLAPEASAAPRRVKAGSKDTLETLADKYDLTVAQLKQWNGLTSSRLKKGQWVYLSPKPVGKTKVAKTTTKSSSKSSKKGSSQPKSASTPKSSSKVKVAKQ